MRHIARLKLALAVVVTFLAGVALPYVVFAQEAPSGALLPADVGGLVAWFKETHASGNWQLLIGGALTLALRFLPLVKPMLDKLPPETTKWVAGGVALVTALGSGLMAGVPLLQAGLNGLKVALVAVGGWEMILKPLLVKFGLQAPVPVAAAGAPTPPSA